MNINGLFVFKNSSAIKNQKNPISITFYESHLVFELAHSSHHSTQSSSHLLDPSSREESGDYSDGVLDIKNHPPQIRTETFNIHYSQIEIEVGGNNDSLLFISSPQKLGSNIIYVEAHKNLITLLKKQENLKHHFSTKNKITKQAPIWSVASGLLFFIFLLIYYRGPLFGSIGELIPFKVEQKIAENIFKKKITEKQIQTQKELIKLLSEIKLNNEWDQRFTFHLSSDTEPNAYATLGGHIFINKGLIQQLETPEQLLGVVAHEMIHVKNRHVMRQLSQSLGLFMILQILVGDITGVVAVLADKGGPLLSLQYSRGLEDEADQEALQLLTQNQINPIGLSESLQIIMNEQKKLLSEMPASDVLEKIQKIEILSSHPEPEKRIALLKAKAQEINKSTPLKKINFDFNNFKQQIKDHY